MAATDAFSNNGLYWTSVLPIALRLANARTGVVSGCAVSQQAAPDMTVQSALGVVMIAGARISVAADATITINAAHASFDRYDLITLNTSGAIVYTAGTANATPVPPEIPANQVPIAVIYVAASATNIPDAAIYDVRITVQDNSSFYAGDGSDGALTVAAGTTTLTTPIKQYSSISISNGATLTFSGSYGKYFIYCTGDAQIDGNITLTAPAGTLPTTFDASNATAANIRAKGAGGISKTKYALYLQPSQMKLPAEGGTAAAGAAGEGGGGAAGAAGTSRAIILYLYVGGKLTYGTTATCTGNGTNGTNGGASGSTAGGGGGGGGAAGAIIMLVKGDGTVSAGCVISLQGGNGGNGGAGSSVPGASTGGGGGGGGASYAGDGGDGGNGGTQASSGTSDGAGGGSGAGGLWFCVCGGQYTNSGTINVAAGTPGTTTGNGGAQAGSTGATGVNIGISNAF